MTRQEALKEFDEMSAALHDVFCGCRTCTCPKEYAQAREVFAHGPTPEPSEIAQLRARLAVAEKDRDRWRSGFRELVSCTVDHAAGMETTK